MLSEVCYQKADTAGQVTYDRKKELMMMEVVVKSCKKLCYNGLLVVTI